MQLIDLNAQQQRLGSRLNTRLNKVLCRGDYIMGHDVQQLEQALATYTGVKHCVSCANGTDALQLALMALDIGPGDIVYTTAFSFFATAEVIALVGATPYFVDVELKTFNLCPTSLQRAIELTPEDAGKKKAVIVADLFGLPACYPAIQAVCEQFSLFLIEDSAQGFGGSIEGRKAGTFGDIATTSFFPAKPLGCYGDGGALFTDDDALAELCRSLRVHGKGSHKYENVRIGLNSRLDTIQAAILLEKLEIFDSECRARNNNAKYYNANITKHYQLPEICDGFESSWAQYTLFHQHIPRETILDEMKQAGIPNAIYYPTPLNEQRAFFGCLSVPTPNTQFLCKRVFSIPVHPYLSESEKQLVVETLNGIKT